MEGLVTYSGTTLTMTTDKTNGSGTHTDWKLNVVGELGAGDMSSANYASEYVGHEAAVRTNIGAASLSDLAAVSDFFRGLAYYPNATTPTTKLDVTAGACRDSLSISTINLTSTITKDVTAAWVAGSENGASVSSAANNTTAARISGAARREMRCQSALDWDPLSASKRDPFERRVLPVALAASELAGVAETVRARVV